MNLGFEISGESTVVLEKEKELRYRNQINTAKTSDIGRSKLEPRIQSSQPRRRLSQPRGWDRCFDLSTLGLIIVHWLQAGFQIAMAHMAVFLTEHRI